MNKMIFLLTLCLFSSLFCKSTQEQCKPLVVCQLCELVYERTYYLGRLEKVLYLFQTFNKHHKINTNLNDLNCDQFSHPQIKKLIASLENSHDLTPLFELWNELHEYKYINDEILMKEFTQLVLIATKKLCPTCYARTACPSDIMFDLVGESFTEAVTLRNYCVKRLSRTFKLLNSIQCSKENIFEVATSSPTCSCIFETHLKFQHSAIVVCINNMDTTNSIKPLMDLFEEFKGFRLIQDKKFNKEFLSLIFAVLKNLITYNINHEATPSNKSTLEFVMNIYTNLDKLPLEQMLEAIDLLSQELPQLLEKYDLENETDWKKWLKEHWWVPPVVITTLGIKVFLIFKYAVPRQAPYSRAPADGAPIADDLAHSSGEEYS